MNHIYKSIFNKALGVFTAVPEFASAHGKGSERTVVGRVAKGTAGFAASALAISVGLALTSTSAVASAGIYVNDGTDVGCVALPDSPSPNTGIYGIVGSNISVPNSMIKQGHTLPANSYLGLDKMNPCRPVGDAVHAAATQTNRTLFYGNTHVVDTSNNGSKNLTLGGRLDVNSGIIGVGDRGTNGAGATNSIRMGTGTTLDEANKQLNAISIGVDAGASALSTTAIGANAKARAEYSVALGDSAVSGDNTVGAVNGGGGAIAIGRQSMANNYNAIAIGMSASVSPAAGVTTASDGIAIGSETVVDNYKGIAVGAYSQAKGRQSTVIANNVQGSNYSTASGTRSQVYGAETNVSGNNSVAIGDTNNVASARTYAMGNNIKVATGADDSLVFGTQANVGAVNSIAMGTTAAATGISSIALGKSAKATDQRTIAMGENALAGNEASMALGYNSSAKGSKQVSIGLGAGALKKATDAGAELATFVGHYAGADNAAATGNAQGVAVGVNAGRYGVAGIRNVAVGSNTGQTVNGNDNTSIGYNSGRSVEGSGNLSGGLNSGVFVKGSNNVALGSNSGNGTVAQALEANNTVAIGNNAKASANNGTAIGLQSKATTDDSLAIGTFAESGGPTTGGSLGTKAIAIGYAAKALGTSAVAMGYGSTVENGHDSIAIGVYAKSTNKKSTAIGTLSEASGEQSTVISNNFDAKGGKSVSVASGRRSQIYGAETTVSGEQSVAIGDTNKIESARTYALGNNINVKAGADDSLAFGSSAAVGAANTVAIGANANAAQANSVALGAGSATDAPHTGDYTLNNSYTAAGLPNAANGTVSVGAAGKERQIQNVAAGVISATSTDAINGSQLYATNNYMNNFAGDVKTKLGGNAALGNDGHLTMTNIGGTGKDNVNDAIAAANTKVVAGDNITVTPTTNADGSKTYTVATTKDLVVNSVQAGDTTVNTNGVTIANGPSVTKTGINADNKKITGVADGNVAAGSTDAVNGSQLHTTNAKLERVRDSLKDVMGGNATVTPLGDVTTSDIGGTGKDTVHDAIKAVNDKAKTAVQEIESANPDALSVKKDGTKVTLTPNVIAGDLVNPTTGAVNTPAAGDAGKLVTAGTVAKALAETHFVVDTKATAGGELDGASQADQKIKSGNKVTLQAGKNLKAKQTNGANGAQVEFSLKDSISLTQVTAGTGANQVVLGNNGVQVGGNTLNSDGLTIAGGPSVKKDGINAGNKKITGVANGNVAAGSTDAVNGAQLHNVATSVANVLGGNAAVDGNGNVTSSNIGGTGANTVDDAIKAVNATAAKHTTVVEGKNVKVTKGKNAAGGDEYTVATKDDLNVTSVNAGNTTVNTNGLTITGGPSVTRGGIDAGNRIISGVKAGDVSATSQEAVNGSQLHATNTKLGDVKAKADTAVQDVKSGNENALTAEKDPNTNIVTVTPKLSGDLVDANGNITAPTTPADKGKLVTAGTVAQALANTHFVVDTAKTDGELDTASEHDQKIKASNKVTLQAGKNLKAKQTNGANGAQVEFSLKDSISLTSLTAATVTAGTGDNQVVLNDTGVNVGNKNYINKDGLNANGNKIANVKAGDVSATSTDAVNGAQLHATNTKLDGVKATADSAVQNVVSSKPTALTANKVGNTVTLTPNFIAGNLVNADGTVNAPAAADEGKLVSAKAVADALKANHFVVDTKANGGTVGAASEENAKVGSGNKVTFEAGKNLVAQQTNTANGGATVKFSLQDEISLKKVTAGTGANQVVLGNDGVKVGNSTLNDKGLTINNGPSVTDAGIDAGNKKITGVANGNVATGSTDAVNGSQLAEVKATADSAVKSVNVAKGEQNLVVDNTDSKNPKLSLKKDLTVESVKAGNTTVDNNGVTINNGPSMTKGGINAGGKAVTNVGDGKVEAGSKDAVNGGQLFEVAQKANGAVQDIKSGNEKALSVEKKGNTYTITPNLIGELVDADGNVTPLTTPEDKGKLVTAGTVAQALENTHFLVNTVATAGGELDAASQADQKIKAGNKVTFQAGKNLKAKQTNGANGTEVEFSLQDNVTVKTVNTDNVKANNGIEIVDGPSMTKDGINAAGKAISNVANGNVAKGSKDAVNGGQLHETAQSVADVIGGGATVKDGKVVAGKNGIGNTGQNTVHGAIAAINQNTANNFNQIRGDLRKMDRDLRGGIAGALATAGLPQAFRPGKSMVAAAASTYRGQSGLAIGVSRISDNGKIILKVTGNTNSRGDFGGTIGAGYQW